MVCNKKGQAAFEFLGTYGWALLAIAVVFSALFFFDVLNVDQSLPNRCELGEGVACPSASITKIDSDTLFVEMNLMNSNDEHIEIESIKIRLKGYDSYCTSSLVSATDGGLINENISSFGDDKDMRFVLANGVNCDLTSSGLDVGLGEKEQFDLILVYKKGQSTLPITSTGVMSAILIDNTTGAPSVCASSVNCVDDCGYEGYSANYGATCYTDTACSTLCTPPPPGSIVQSINLLYTGGAYTEYLISFYVTPSDLDMKTIFQPLINEGSLLLVQDDSGNQLHFSAGSWINDIGDMSYKEGYLVRVNASKQLLIMGTPVPSTYSLNLQAGVNYVGFPDKTVNALEAVLPMFKNNNLDYVQDITGNKVDWSAGSRSFSNAIGSMQKGKGYIVVADQAMVVDFPYSLNGRSYQALQLSGGQDYISLYVDSGESAMDLFLPLIAKGDILSIQDMDAGTTLEGPGWTDNIGATTSRTVYEINSSSFCLSGECLLVTMGSGDFGSWTYNYDAGINYIGIPLMSEMRALEGFTVPIAQNKFVSLSDGLIAMKKDVTGTSWVNSDISLFSGKGYIFESSSAGSFTLPHDLDCVADDSCGISYRSRSTGLTYQNSACTGNVCAMASDECVLEPGCEGVCGAPGYVDMGTGECHFTSTCKSPACSGQLFIQRVNLTAGENLVSFYVEPTSSDSNLLFQQLLDENALISVEDDSGIMEYTQDGWKYLPNPIQNGEGYNIIVNQDTQLIVEGNNYYEQPRTLDFDLEVNRFGIPKSTEEVTASLDPFRLFTDVVASGYFEKVESLSGEFSFTPDVGWTNTLGNIELGKGYLLYLKGSPVSLNIPRDGNCIISSGCCTGGICYTDVTEPDSCFTDVLCTNPYSAGCVQEDTCSGACSGTGYSDNGGLNCYTDISCGSECVPPCVWEAGYCSGLGGYSNDGGVTIFTDSSCTNPGCPMPVCEYVGSCCKGTGGYSYNGGVECFYDSGCSEPVCKYSQSVDLAPGTSLFSVYVDDPMPLVEILRPYLDSHQIITITTDDGKQIYFDSDLGEWIDNIGPATLLDGYLADTNSLVRITFSGPHFEIPTVAIFDAKPKANLFGVPLTMNPVTALELFTPLRDSKNLINVTSDTGRSLFYDSIFSQWVDNIGEMVPGEGYIVYVNNPDSLDMTEYINS